MKMTFFTSSSVRLLARNDKFFYLCQKLPLILSDQPGIVKRMCHSRMEILTGKATVTKGLLCLANSQLIQHLHQQ